MSEKGFAQLGNFIKEFQQDFCFSSLEGQNLCTEKSLEGANKFQNFVILALDDTRMVKRDWKSLLHFVKQTILNPWNDRQYEFVVFSCYEDEAINIINCLSVLSAVALKKGDTKSLEEIQRIVIQYQHHPGAGFVMNNLGVMFSENAMYKMSEECFEIAKSYFERSLCKQDNQRDACAVVSLNLAVLHKVLGKYEEAERLCAVAASLCHDISMRTTKDVHLPWKLLRRVADMLKEFGNFKKSDIIMRIGVHYDVSGNDEVATIDLTKQLMKIQLKEECHKKIQAKEVEDYISYLFAVLNKPAAELLNAEFIGTVTSAAKIHRDIGHCEEACKLLKKLKKAFLMVHGGRCSLYGSLLYQIGSFLHGTGKFDKAESVLKQAKEILIHHLGRNHHAVAKCKSLLGSCFLLKGNAKVALKHLNEALTTFKNLNSNHPEVGEILLKLAFFHVEDGNLQYAQKAIQEALDIFISGCGEFSCTTAGAYFQLGLILQKVDEFRTSAVNKIKKAIKIFLNLGLNLDHPDVKLCHSFLGVLQRSLGMVEEAEKSFLDVQTGASLCKDSCRVASRIITPEITNLHFQVSDDCRGAFSSSETQFISLVNLVHMKKGDERVKYLDTLVSCVEQLETEELQISNFAGQNLYCISHKVPASDRNVFIIIDTLESDNSIDSDVFLSSSARKSHFVLFSMIPHKVQDKQEVKCLASAFREGVNTLFLQPKFRKDYVDGKDFYMELTLPGDISSLSGQIDCLPLLVELELSESQEQCNNFDYLTSWESSMKSVKSSAHVSYFSFKCSNQRETEFVFYHLVHNLDQNLALNKVQAVVSNVSLLQNSASFLFQEPRNSSLSVVADSETVLVKCRTIKESELNCVCCSVRNALDVAMELCQTVCVNVESSAWLTCKGVGAGLGIEESSSRSCNLGVQSDPSCSGLISEAGDSIRCGRTRSRVPESELKRKPAAETVDRLDILQDENMEVDPHVSIPRDNFHADVDVCLCLLSCLLCQARPVSSEEEALPLNSSAVSSTDFARCDSNIPDHDHSFLSVCSSSSLNSLPLSPFVLPVSGQFLFTSKKPSSECLLSEDNGHTPSETSTCMNSKHLSKNSSTDSDKGSGLSVKLPEKPSPDACHMSSYEEGLTAGECCPGPETRGTKQLEDSCQLQTSIADVNVEKRLCLAIDRKGGVQGITTNDGELLPTKGPEDLHGYQNQQQDVSVEFLQSIPGPSSGASSEKIDAGTLTDDCLRPLLANLEDELSAFQKERLELQHQISQLEEQLKQSEQEKQNLQADLGKYQFFEDKEKRRGRLLSGAAPLQDPAALGKYQLLEGKERHCERLLGVAAAVQDPGFSLRARLLEISNSLSAEEVKQIKFLAKRKINGFRLARFSEAFELFEELEMNGEFPCDFIGKLLAGIQRYDLAEKLGIHVSLLETERGSNHPPGQSMPERKSDLPDHASNSAKSVAAQDNRIDVLPDRGDRKRHLSDDGNRNDHLSRTEETDYDCNKYASISSSGSSDETHHYTTEEQLNSSHMAMSHINAESNSSSLQSAINATKSNQLPNSSDNDFLSDSSCSTTVSSSESSVNSAHSTQAAVLSSTIQSSSDSTDGSPMLTSGNSHSAYGSDEISSDSGLTPTSSEEENLKSSQMLANGGEESEGRDVCDGAIRTAPSCISACAVGAGANSSDSSACGFVRTQSGANVGNIPWSQQGAFPSAGMTSGAFKNTVTDWERLGARPKQGRVIKKMPGEPFIPITDGLAGDFLARHTQDKALHDSLYQSVGAETPLFNDTAPQGASFIDGVMNVSDSNKAKPYFGDYQTAYGTDPYNRLDISSGQFDGRGIFYSEHLNNNTGPLPSHLGGNYFSVYGNYSQRNTLNATNCPSLQSGFVHNNSRFLDHFGGVPHLPLETQQGPNPSVPSNQVFNSGVTGSSFADPTCNDSTVGHPGHPVSGAQSNTFFNNNTSTLTSAQSMRQTPHNRNLALGNHSNSTTNSDNVPSACAKNIPRGDVQNSALSAAHAVSSCDPTRTTGLDSTNTSWPSLVCHSSNTTTVGDDVLVQRSASGTSIPDPSCVNADNSRASGLNNRDFGTDSVESTDNSLLALEQRVAEACALVERVLKEREEREQFGREIERKEQLIREQRARERREREEREIREAERWPQQQEAITARSQWLCEHYQRHCRVRFPCCTQFYPCHRCHNISKACDNEEAKACHASHLKCSHCQHEQEIGEDSEKCRKCGGKMAAYFCSICKHFTSVDKNPYHCEKCGICRIHKDKSFHCEVCNVCLDKRLEGNHKCRPDSGHDECCICLEDAFSGCQILPCSHKVHRECAIAMIQNGIRTCPICRHPLYSQPRE